MRRCRATAVPHADRRALARLLARARRDARRGGGAWRAPVPVRHARDRMRAMDRARARSFAIVAIAYVAAGVVAWLVATRVADGWSAWSALLAADVAATAVVFAFS